MGVDECVLYRLDFMKDFCVKELEGTAPGACRADARDLYRKLKAGKIFGAFNDQDREKIWAEVCRRTKDRLVPSFFTFFEDLNWLKGPADCVKRLIPISPDDTILYALEQYVFTGVNQQSGHCLIQKPDHTFVSKPGTEADQMNLGVLQLFLIAMRNHLNMPAEPKKKNLLAKPRPKKADPEVLHEFAAHAHRLGFESDEIRELTELKTTSRAPQKEEPESPSRTTQINPDEFKEGNIPMLLQNQSSTPDHNEIMEVGQSTATERQCEDQGMVQMVTENVVHEITTSDIPTLHGEVTAPKTVAPAEAERRREAQEQQTTEQTFREPDERQMMERTQDERGGREGQHDTAKEQGHQATSERIDGAQRTPPQEMGQAYDSPPRDQVLLDEAERGSIDSQMRRDREESLFSPESMSPTDESTNVQTAPQNRIETAPQQGANGSVNGIEETPPMLIVDQQHELSPAQEVNAATEEVERISTAEMKDSAEREAIPTLPQSEILGREQERLEELGGRVSQDQEHYEDEIGLEQRKRKTPDLDSGPAIEGRSQLQDPNSSPIIRESDRKRVTQINFGRLEELESLERPREMLSPGHDRDGVRDGGELIAREDEIVPDVQEELRGDRQARYEPLSGEGNRAGVENIERTIDDRLRGQENEEKTARARKKAVMKEVERRRQERVRQLKNEKPELVSEQKMTRERARDQQERQVKEDEGMRRKRTTQIDFGRLGDAVHGQPKPKESASRRPITENETGAGPAEVVVRDSDVTATTSQQPAEPPKLTTEGPGPQKIRIHLKISDGRLGGEDWESLSSHDVNPSEPADFMRLLRKYTRKDTENPWNVFAG
ncbi:hypothetical protein KCU88_g7485, partial [Aureobasidium melanogenum]